MLGLDRLSSPWLARAAALLLAAVLLLAVRALVPGALSSVEERSGDVLWRMFPAAGEERRVIVVDIDEASLGQYGPWPWPRERMAQLSRRLGELGAGVQVYDVVFPEASANDKEFAAALAAQPTVLAQIFALGEESPSAAGSLQGQLAQPACASLLPQAHGYIGNAAKLIAGAAGHITPRLGADGAVRSLPGLICYAGKAYPALGIAAVLKAAQAAPALTLSRGQGWLAPDWQLTHEALPGIGVPLDERGDVRLSYRLPRQAFVSVSAANVLSGKAPPELFRGAIVLVGATAFGIGDAVPTPHGGAVSGVEVHAQFISALLDGQLPYAPRVAPLLQLLLAVAGSGLLLFLASRRGRVYVYGPPLAAVLLALGFFVLHGRLLLVDHLWLGWAAGAAYCLLAGVMLAVVEHARARLERERLYRNLSSYLPAAVAEQIALREPSGNIEAERREISLLFADIRNFSAYCEGRPPEEAATLLHAFFTIATRVVEAQGGYVQEFIGDSIMAVWNAESPCADHTARAYAAARQLLDEIESLFLNPPPPGLEPLALGVGLETGIALVGSFGPARRRTHSVLGETVTVAARLQHMTADLAQPMLVGEGAAAKLPPGSLVSLGEFLLEGLRRPRLIHAPVARAQAPIPIRAGVGEKRAA